MSLIERTIRVDYQLRVHFTRNVFGAANPLLNNLLVSEPGNRIHRVLVVLDESLAQARLDLPREIEAYFAQSADRLELACPPLIIEGGERTKNSYFHVSEIHSHIDRYHVDRHS